MGRRCGRVYLLSDQELCLWRTAAPDQSVSCVPIPKVHAVCAPGLAALEPGTSDGRESFQMNSLVDRQLAPGLHFAAWEIFYHSSLCSPLSAARFPSPAPSPWAKSLPPMPQPTHVRCLLGHRVPRAPFCQPLIYLLGSAESPALCFLQEVLLFLGPWTALPLGCILSWVSSTGCWSPADPQEPSLYMLGGKGAASGFSHYLRIALQFAAVLAVLWLQMQWCWIFLLIWENRATQMVIAACLVGGFIVWWSLYMYFCLTFATTEQSRCYDYLCFFRWESC